MTKIQDIIERIETLTVEAYGKTYDYAALGFKLTELDYNYMDDSISFVLTSDEHEVGELWEILDILDEPETYTYTVTNIKEYGNNNKVYECSNIDIFIDEIAATVKTYNPETHTI